jgi:hypothetical protein
VIGREVIFAAIILPFDAIEKWAIFVLFWYDIGDVSRYHIGVAILDI